MCETGVRPISVRDQGARSRSAGVRNCPRQSSEKSLPWITAGPAPSGFGRPRVSGPATCRRVCERRISSSRCARRLRFQWCARGWPWPDAGEEDHDDLTSRREAPACLVRRPINSRLPPLRSPGRWKGGGCGNGGTVASRSADPRWWGSRDSRRGKPRPWGRTWAKRSIGTAARWSASTRRTPISPTSSAGRRRCLMRGRRGNRPIAASRAGDRGWFWSWSILGTERSRTP